MSQRYVHRFCALIYCGFISIIKYNERHKWISTALQAIQLFYHKRLWKITIPLIYPTYSLSCYLRNRIAPPMLCNSVLLIYIQTSMCLGECYEITWIRVTHNVDYDEWPVIDFRYGLVKVMESGVTNKSICDQRFLCKLTNSRELQKDDLAGNVSSEPVNFHGLRGKTWIDIDMNKAVRWIPPPVPLWFTSDSRLMPTVW